MPETNTPTASPTVSSTIGLKDVVIAPLTVDNETTVTYGTLQKIAGAIEASVAPNNADPDIQYADDGEFDTLYADPEVALTLKMADLPLTIQEMILSNKVDDNGVLIRAAQDKPGYFAIGFRSVKSNGKYRYVWLFKCRAKPITENFATKEGNTVTRQEPEVEFTAIKRTKDGYWQAVADEGENGFDATDGAAFLATVYTPTFTDSSEG